MKVIFLDVDGVLNSGQYFVKLNKIYAGTGIYPKQDDKLDPKLIARLNKITDVTAAKIVVSSTWRIGYLHDIRPLRELFARKGITGEVIGITAYDSQIRGLQIYDWLSSQVRGLIDSYVIIDDNSDMGMLKDRLVLTKFDCGLSDSDVDLAIDMLRTPVNTVT